MSELSLNNIPILLPASQTESVVFNPDTQELTIRAIFPGAEDWDLRYEYRFKVSEVIAHSIIGVVPKKDQL